MIASPGLVAAHVAAHREAENLSSASAPSSSRHRPGGDWFGSAYAAAWNERYATLAGKQPDWPDCYGGNFSAPRAALLRGRRRSTPSSPRSRTSSSASGSARRAATPRYLPDAHGIHDDQKDRGRILAAGIGYGAFCAEFAEREPAARPKLLGWFLDTTAREVLLRRALLTLRMPPAAIAPLGRLIPGAGRRQVWFGFVSRYAFWRGVRGATSRERWLQTTRGVPVLMYHAFADGSEAEPLRDAAPAPSPARCACWRRCATG